MPRRRCLAVLAFLVLAAAAHAGFDEGEQAFKRRDFRTAVSEFTPLADGGDARAQYYLGVMFLAGLGASRDEAKAADYLARSAAQNYARAQTVLGTLYLQGRGVPKDEAKGADLVRRAADTGLASAQHMMGLLLMEGRGGLPKDPATAAQWFKAAADQNHVAAYCALGELANRENNAVEAVAWWRKGATGGDRNCQLLLGRAYLEGKGGLPRDTNEGVAWIRRAANLRLPAAQAALAMAYERGAGVPTDYVLAYMWFNLARSQGYNPQPMRETMEALEKKMTPEQIAEAQKRSREWRAGADVADAIARAAPRGPASGRGAAHDVRERVPRLRRRPHRHQSPRHRGLPESHRRAGQRRGGGRSARRAQRPRAPQGSERPTAVASLRSGRGVRPGDDVVVVGFPLRQVLAPNPVVTTGTVSALKRPRQRHREAPDRGAGPAGQQRRTAARPPRPGRRRGAEQAQRAAHRRRHRRHPAERQLRGERRKPAELPRSERRGLPRCAARRPGALRGGRRRAGRALHRRDRACPVSAQPCARGAAHPCHAESPSRSIDVREVVGTISVSASTFRYTE